VPSPDTSKSESNQSSDNSKKISATKAENDFVPKAEADLVELWVCLQSEFPMTWKSYYNDASMNLKAMIDTKRSELEAIFDE